MKRTRIAATLLTAAFGVACTQQTAPATDHSASSTAHQQTASHDSAPASTAPQASPATQPSGTTSLQTNTPPIAAAPAPGATPEMVRRMSAAEAKAMVDRGALTVIDVRDAASYAHGHIAGALNVPLDQMQANPQLVPRGKPVLTYCT